MIKKLAIALVALLAMGGTVSAFAWWDTLNDTQNETLTIGEGTDLVVGVNVAAPAGKTLIPSGFVLGPDDGQSILLSYNVNLSKVTASDLTLAVSATNVTIGGSAVNAGLVGIVISPTTTSINSGVVVVTVTVTLSEPATEVVYDAVVNGQIAFDLVFNAS